MDEKWDGVKELIERVQSSTFVGKFLAYASDHRLDL